MRFGAHTSTSGGLSKAIERALQIGAEICQIFVKNNMQWFGRQQTPAELAQYANDFNACGFACVFGHSGYLINLGAPPSKNRDYSLKSLLQEIDLATNLELPFLVMHPGAHLETGEANGIKRIVAGLNDGGIERGGNSSNVCENFRISAITPYIWAT